MFFFCCVDFDGRPIDTISLFRQFNLLDESVSVVMSIFFLSSSIVVRSIAGLVSSFGTTPPIPLVA